jgi:two-component sensor histidine kinase
VQALARAHEVSVGNDPMGGFDLEALVKATLAPYAQTGISLEISGPPVELPPMRVTPLGLIVHELATNAIKYGAWSGDGGKVEVCWSITIEASRRDAPSKDRLRLEWKEVGTERLEPEGDPGFGSRMIEAAVAQLDGRLIRERGEHGVSVVIDAPIVRAQAET